MSKDCRICCETKEDSEFNAASTMRDGLEPYCKRCKNKMSAENYRSKRIGKKHNQSDEHRNGVLCRNFGITLDCYKRMIREQEGKCAICKIMFEGLNVDHCHKTGIVRGLLCDNCNLALGHFKDEPVLLEIAIVYLKKERPKPTLEQIVRKLGGLV